MEINLTPAQVWRIAVGAAVGLPAIAGATWSVFVWFDSIPDDGDVREIVRQELRRSRSVEHIQNLTTLLEDLSTEDPKREAHIALIRDLCETVEPPKPEACE